MLSTAAVCERYCGVRSALNLELKANNNAPRISEAVAMPQILARDARRSKVDPVQLSRTNRNSGSDANIDSTTDRRRESCGRGIDVETRSRVRESHSRGIDTH